MYVEGRPHRKRDAVVTYEVTRTSVIEKDLVNRVVLCYLNRHRWPLANHLSLVLPLVSVAAVIVNAEVNL